MKNNGKVRDVLCLTIQWNILEMVCCKGMNPALTLPILQVDMGEFAECPSQDVARTHTGWSGLKPTMDNYLVNYYIFVFFYQ